MHLKITERSETFSVGKIVTAIEKETDNGEGSILNQKPVTSHSEAETVLSNS